MTSLKVNGRQLRLDADRVAVLPGPARGDRPRTPQVEATGRRIRELPLSKSIRV